MDIWQQIKTVGWNGEWYFLSIIDDFSGWVAIYPLCEKSEVLEVIKCHVARAKRQFGKKLKTLRCDNSSEFQDKYFKQYCSKSGIKQEFTNVNSPEQDGVCEGFNQTALNCVRSILSDNGLSHKFWPDGVLYFSYMWNRICHKG